MRQAGRSLPEYRALRAGGNMLDACLDPALSSEITMQPVRRHGVDAAIFFSDIVVPLLLVGIDVEIVPGRGPVFASPVRTSHDIAAITRIDPDVLFDRGQSVAEGVGRTTLLLKDESDERGEPLPLIGFAGAPFTLAAYLVEGGPSKEHMAARRLMLSDPAGWNDLMAWLAEVSGRFLQLQVEAGASAVQLFDSWVGSLSAADYRERVQPHSRATLDAVRALSAPEASDFTPIPLIHFGVGTGELLADMAAIGVDAMGVDHRLDFTTALARIGRDVTVQGNLDPALLAAPEAVRTAAIHRILQDAQQARAHVFNLGHGVPLDTDPDVLGDVVRTVHAWRA